MKTTCVLIVDDDALARAFLRDCLVPLGVELHEAMDGVDALERARELRPDVIFLDLVMPHRSGLELLRLLRAEANQARIYVVSSLDAQSLVQQALADGAAGFLGKPFHPLDVQQLVTAARDSL